MIETSSVEKIFHSINCYIFQTTMNIEEISENQPLYEKAFDLRYTLFFKNFGLPRSVTADELEPISSHLAISENGQLLAYGRLSPIDSDTFRISQVVVPDEHRRKGYATVIVNHLIKIAKCNGAKKISLNSQVAVAELYKKIGFQEAGQVYKVKLTGLKHLKMIYEINA